MTLTKSRSHLAPLGMGYFSLFFINQALFALAIPFFQMSLAYDPLLLNIALATPIGLVAIIHPKLERWLNKYSNISYENMYLIMIALICGLSFSIIWWLPYIFDQAILLLLFTVSLIFHISGALLTIYIKGLTYSYAQSVTHKPSFFSWLGLYERCGALVYYWLFPLAQLSIWGSLLNGMAVIGSLVGIGIITLLSVIAMRFLTHNTRIIKQADVNLNKRIIFNKTESTALKVLYSLLVIKLGLVTAFSSLDYYVLVYYVNNDIQQGAFWKGLISSAFAIISILLVPVMKQLLTYYNPLNVLQGIYAISFIGAIAKWFIYTPSNEYWLLLDALLGASSFVALVVIVPMLLSDISGRYNARDNGSAERNIATKQSQVTLFSMLSSFIIGGVLLNWFGFDAQLQQQQSVQTIKYLRFGLAGGSALFNLISLIILTMYPYKGLLLSQQRQYQEKN